MAKIYKFPENKKEPTISPSTANTMYEFFKSKSRFIDAPKVDPTKLPFTNDEWENFYNVNNEPVDETRSYSNSEDFTGERGNVEIRGITLRDLSDMLVRSYVRNGKNSILNTLSDVNKLVYDDVYTISCNNVDPLKLINSLLVDIEEKIMNKKEIE